MKSALLYTGAAAAALAAGGGAAWAVMRATGDDDAPGARPQLDAESPSGRPEPEPEPEPAVPVVPVAPAAGSRPFPGSIQHYEPQAAGDTSAVGRSAALERVLAPVELLAAQTAAGHVTAPSADAAPEVVGQWSDRLVRDAARHARKAREARGAGDRMTARSQALLAVSAAGALEAAALEAAGGRGGAARAPRALAQELRMDATRANRQARRAVADVLGGAARRPEAALERLGTKAVEDSRAATGQLPAGALPAVAEAMASGAAAAYDAGLAAWLVDHPNDVPGDRRAAARQASEAATAQRALYGYSDRAVSVLDLARRSVAAAEAAEAAAGAGNAARAKRQLESAQHMAIAATMLGFGNDESFSEGDRQGAFEAAMAAGVPAARHAVIEAAVSSEADAAAAAAERAHKALDRAGIEAPDLDEVLDLT